jgi:hypothetical protein
LFLVPPEERPHRFGPTTVDAININSKHDFCWHSTKDRINPILVHKLLTEELILQRKVTHFLCKTAVVSGYSVDATISDTPRGNKPYADQQSFPEGFEKLTFISMAEMRSFCLAQIRKRYSFEYFTAFS